MDVEYVRVWGRSKVKTVDMPGNSRASKVQENIIMYRKLCSIDVNRYNL